MSITVQEFDEMAAKESLKACPKIVQDYVKIIERHNENWRQLTQKAVAKINVLSKEKKQARLNAFSEYRSELKTMIPSSELAIIDSFVAGRIPDFKYISK